MASDNFGADAMDVLREWGLSDNPLKIVAAARLTSNAGHTFVFAHDGFVRDVLMQATSLGEGVLKRVQQEFWSTASSLSYGSAVGEAPPELLQAESRALETSAQHRDAPNVAGFYSSLAAYYRDSITRSLLGDEELQNR